tara:strand:- start:4851 stop:7166 length:2316 start_codon:yes stop_codon:yes gene_type:complete
MADKDLEKYLKGLKRNSALANVRRPASMGGGMVYDKKAEREKIEQEYFQSTLKPQARFTGMPVNNAQADRRARVQNQQMDQKVLQEADLRNQFDQARSLGGDIGREAIRDVAMNNPGGVETFNKMNKGKITFAELTEGLGNPQKMPYKPSDTDLMQMENLVRQGMMPDDIRANPEMAKVYNHSQRLQSLGERNVQAMLSSEEAQIASAQRDREYKKQRAMEEVAERDRMLASGPNMYYGPGMTRDSIMEQANNAVKYGEKDNIMAMVQGVMGGDRIGKTQGLMGMLNMRAVMKTAGADDKMLAEFDELGQNARINKMGRDLKKMYGDRPLDATQLADKRNQEKEDKRLAKAMAPVPVKGGMKNRKSPLKEALLKSQLFAGRMAKGFTDDSYKQYVQRGGYITKDGKQGYLLGGLATALAPALIGAGKTALASKAAGAATGGAATGGGGLLSGISSMFGGMKDRYMDNPVAAGKLESIMNSTDSEGNPIGEAEARQIRDAGGGSADLATTIGRGAKEFGKDSLSGLVGIGQGLAGAGVGIGKGLQAGYKGLTDNKASYEDLASGKEKGSLLQRLGKGMSFAGNVVDMANEEIPFSSMGQSDVQFYSGKDGATKPKQQAYVNDADNVEMPDTDVPQDQVSKDIKDGQVGKTGVEMEGVDGKVIPASILDKVKDMDSLKGLKPEQLMTVQKALGGIAVDGKFGPETMGAMQKYFDNANRAPIEQPRPEPAPVRSREEIIQSYPVGVDPSNPFPIIKQEGGFISKLMAYQNGGLV